MAATLWELGLVQTRAGKEFVNVIHCVDETGSMDPSDVEAALGDAWVADNSFADVVQVDAVHYTATRLRDITNGLATIEIPWSNAITTGAASTEGWPPSVAMCYTVKTLLAGRSHRGRMYIGGGLHSAYNSTQTAFDLTGSAGVLCSGAGEAFRSALDAGGLNLHVYSRKLGTSQLAFSVLPHAGLASQRKRANRYALP